MWSVVLHPLLKPAWLMLILVFVSRNHWSRLAKILSIVLQRHDVRATGLYELGSSSVLPGFSRGITIDSFHFAGTAPFVSSTFSRCWIDFLLVSERFLNILLCTRSVPTALLFDLGRLLLISSIVIGSFRGFGASDWACMVIASSYLRFPGMPVGCTALNWSRNAWAFSLGSLQITSFRRVSGTILCPSYPLRRPTFSVGRPGPVC